MFDNLQDRLNSVFKKFKGQGRLDESNIQEGLREVRLALLEADVNFKVVKDFISRVKERCLGQDVLGSLTPGQQVVKIVHEEMIGLLGGETKGARVRRPRRPSSPCICAGRSASPTWCPQTSTARRPSTS